VPTAKGLKQVRDGQEEKKQEKWDNDEKRKTKHRYFLNCCRLHGI
jgi:hypothetical protein